MKTTMPLTKWIVVPKFRDFYFQYAYFYLGQDTDNREWAFWVFLQSFHEILIDSIISHFFPVPFYFNIHQLSHVSHILVANNVKKYSL